MLTRLLDSQEGERLGQLVVNGFDYQELQNGVVSVLFEYQKLGNLRGGYDD